MVGSVPVTDTVMSRKKVKVIDLFCGIGGLSFGLIKEGLDVVAGIDSDSACRFGYENSNNVKFIHRDIRAVNSEEIGELFGNVDTRVLVGCAPCQPFSNLTLKRSTEPQIEPLEKFARLVEETQPTIVSMENVRGLANIKKYPVFKRFIDTLAKNGYEYKYKIVNASDYGVPQRRKRLVLLASKLGEIDLISKTHRTPKTVREAIKNLPPIKAGGTCKSDPLHRSRLLSPMNLRRIKATPHDGGNSQNWDEDLILPCHRKDSGRAYRMSVYGRMRWDEPAPTITTQCLGLGNGNFGHPEQNRVMSLREAALLQTFPQDYLFFDPKKPIATTQVAKFIGNAVPVELGVAIGKSIKNHLRQHGKI